QQVQDEAVLFLLGAVQTGLGLGGAQAPVRLGLLVQELLGDGGVVLGAVDGGGEDECPELGFVLLAVAVDAAVALFDADQRPRQVVVHDVVALAVQVDALGGDVAGDQDTDLAVGEGEVGDDPLLFGVGHAAVHEGDLVGLQAQGLGEFVVQPSEGGHRFGEDDGAGGALAIHPDLLELGDQALELGGGGGVDLVRAVLEFDQGGVFAFQCLVVGGVGARGGGALAFQGLDPVVGGGGQGPVGGQERDEQGVGEEAGGSPYHGRALTGVAGQPHLGEFGEDILLGGAGDDPDGGGGAAV